MEGDSRFYPAVEAVIPDHFPAVYESSSGDIIVYLGAITRDSREMYIGGCPFWLHGKHSEDAEAQAAIQGFYRLESGVIYRDAFLDKDTLFPFEVAEVSRYIDLPTSAFSYFGVCSRETREEDSVATRLVFGLTYEELSEILSIYGNIFGLGNTYQRFPRITRSTQKDNRCDLSYAWIPRNFPYITFDDSTCPFSHISLGAFYKHMRLLLLHGPRSVAWKAMVEAGANEGTLERIVHMQTSWQPPVRYNEFVKPW